MAERRRAVTLGDVARVAGVSVKTASNAVNGTGRMAPATRERIRAIMEDLGYRVNVSARNLSRGTTQTLTLAVHSLAAPYLGLLADAVIAEAQEHGYDTQVLSYGRSGREAARRVVRDFNIHLSDGLLLSTPERLHLTREDLTVPYPLVALGSHSAHGVADRVAVDDRLDSRAITDLLFEGGATAVAVLGAHHRDDHLHAATAEYGNAEVRIRGVMESCAAHGRPLDPRLIGVMGYDWGIGRAFDATNRLIAAGVPFDALVCFNDGLATGALAALRAAGRDVPRDVQVVGFDNVEESAYLFPPLTTVDSSIPWIARTSIERLLARIQNPDGAADTPPREYRTTSRLVIRQSTR